MTVLLIGLRGVLIGYFAKSQLDKDRDALGRCEENKENARHNQKQCLLDPVCCRWTCRLRGARSCCHILGTQKHLDQHPGHNRRAGPLVQG